MRGSDGIVRALAAEGVKYVPGILGGSAHEIVDSLHDVPQIQLILPRHERVAVDIADGYARVSGKIGVALCVQGPGGANAFAGIANSFADSSPVILLHGQVPQQHYMRGATQEMAVSDVFRPVTKWVSTMTQLERIPEIMRRAFTVVNSGRPGPVVLEIPNDVSVGQCEPEKLAYTPIGMRYRSGADPTEVAKAAALLVEARRLVIQAGAGVLWSEGAPELRELAELLAAPVMTTLVGKSSFPENHPLSLGLGGYPQGLFGTRQANKFASEADVVLAIGSSFKAMATNHFAKMPEGARIVQVDADVREIGKNYPVAAGLLGDAKLVLQQVLEAVRDRLGQEQRDSSPVAAEIARVRKEWMSDWMPALTSAETPINPYRVTWELMQNLDPNKTIVLHDSGSVRGYTCHHYVAPFPRAFLGFGGQSAMGWSMGAAIGAKLARPDCIVVNVIGDGSFGMTGMDVETAVRHQIPVLTVIPNNQSLDLAKFSQNRKFRDWPVSTALTGDYTAVARGLGAHAEKVERPEEIAPALKRAVSANLDGQSAVLEIMIKPMVPGPTELRW